MTALVSFQLTLIQFRSTFIGLFQFLHIILYRNLQEYTKRPKVPTDTAESISAQKYHPRHVVHPSHLSLQEALAISDVVISAVPSATYKVKTEWLKDGCACINVAGEKNFEKDVRDKASPLSASQQALYLPFTYDCS